MGLESSVWVWGSQNESEVPRVGWGSQCMLGVFSMGLGSLIWVEGAQNGSGDPTRGSVQYEAKV